MTLEIDTLSALTAWRAALGPEYVADDDATRARYGRTTQCTAPEPLCVLYPGSTEDVCAAVRIASQYGISVYPLSCGKNWGYGDACAPARSAAILDLTRMNRILEVNQELAYAVIEPGVTQRQLSEYLRAHHPSLWMDCTGAGGAASFVGNTLDRGFGHTRYGDHFSSTCGMEVVLADGRVLRTGYGHYPNARAERVYRYGVGPFLDGLFCQSNYGIVTQIGMWLQPAPEAFTFFAISVKERAHLGELVDRLRPLRLAGILPTAVHIGNDLRVLSGQGRYPWQEAGGKTPLPEDVRRRFREARGIGAWNAAGALQGSRAEVRAARRALKRAVGGLGRLVFVGEKLLTIGEWGVSLLERFGLGAKLRGQLEAMKPVYGLLRGEPTEEPLLGAQWRLRNPVSEEPVDPLDAGCGLFWISPVLPMTGRDALAVMDITEPIFMEEGFEALATFTLINERSMIGILNIAFDKSVAEETVRAERCYHRLVEALMQAGYVPYRTGLEGMPKLRDANDVFWQVAEAIKRALDPQDLIARGRYLAPLTPSASPRPGD